MVVEFLIVGDEIVQACLMVNLVSIKVKMMNSHQRMAKNKKS